MSADHVLRHKWVASLHVGGVEKGVLRVLADYANCDTLKCWPSIETIVCESGFCERTVQRALTRLVGANVIGLLPSRGRNRNIFLRIPTVHHIRGWRTSTPYQRHPYPVPDTGLTPYQRHPNQ
jgi:Helix-turn-helix domain